MKPLVVLFLTGALIWAFLKLYPTAGEPETQASRTAGLEQQGTGTERRAEGAQGEPAGDGMFDQVSPEDSIFVDRVLDADRGPEALQLGRLLSQERLGEASSYARREANGLPAWAPEAIQAFSVSLDAGDLEAAREHAKEAHGAGLTAGPALDLLRAALRAGPFPLADAEAERGPIELGMELALHLQAARKAVQAESWIAAEQHYSAAMLGELSAAWPTDPVVLQRWSDEINSFQQRHRWSRQGDWPHVEMSVRQDDSLIALRKRFLAENPGLPMSTGLIAHANDLGETIHPGDTLRIPTEPVEVITDVSSRWLVYTIGGAVAYATQVGVGREGEETLEGVFEVGHKREEPPYWPRGKEMVPYGSPENPLGTRWMGWRFPGQTKDTSYGYHGTWEPESIGKAASEGCVRMLNDDVEFLYEILPGGAANLVRP